MTDKNRILAALRRGPVTPIDFQLPGVVDGGKPILRVAARVNDLRNDGHVITTNKKGRVASYALVREADAPHPTVGIAKGLRTLDVPMGGPNSVYEYDNDGEEWWAA